VVITRKLLLADGPIEETTHVPVREIA
jgi:hypothetical protein